MEKQHGGNIYDAIGVKHYINCSGQLTLLGASSMSPRVWGVMEEANGRYAAMHELMDRAGEIIAETLGAEAASARRLREALTGAVRFTDESVAHPAYLDLERERLAS